MIYFDNGATTYPKPPSVINAVNRALRNGTNPGRSGHRLSLNSSEIIYNCRQSLADFFDVEEPERVVFTESCTAALNTVIHGVLKKGDHVIISSLEHNAVLRPLEHMKQRGVEYSVAKVFEGDDDKTLDSFRKLIRSDTRMIICTHASNVFGIKLPIERIGAMCKIYGLLFCVDAAQTAGVFPISLKNSDIDYLCVAGHKGLYGPMGTGALIINSDVLPDSLVQGGTGSLSAQAAQPEILPDKFESGTPNVIGIAGLSEGIRFVGKRTVSKIDSYENSLAQRLYHKLEKLDNVILYTSQPEYGRYAPVISFNINGLDSEETAKMLWERYGIAVRAGLHCAPLAHRQYDTLEGGTVRAVMSVFNNGSQVDYLASCVKKL